MLLKLGIILIAGLQLDLQVVRLSLDSVSGD